MLNALPPDPAIQPPPDPLEVDGQTGPKTQAAIKQFQSSQGISPSGNADAATRKALFLAYMNLLCVDEHGKSWQLDPKNDFLGHNVDSGGKADFQGCGEFNPLMLFSKDDLQAFDAAKDHTERDEKNRQNRRVMALLFRPGAKVSTKYWPCPKAKEDSSGCRDRFWSDGDQRRANGPEQREYKQTKDTFACRFYQRLVTGSPCEEDIKWTTLLIKLIDDRDKPYAGNAYRLEIGPLKLKGVTSGDGVVQELIPANATSGRLVMLFTPPQGQGDPTDFWSLDLEIVADLGASDTVAGAQARINNLGLFAGTQITGEADSLTVRALQRFQTRFKVQDDSGKPESSGKLTSQTASKLKEVYGS
jgi:peptidoglycan hydrolase-like protein with peptidoglycan-binding domain